jgi:hypothetical protein
MDDSRARVPRILLSGAASGAVTAVGFAALHDLLISDIWFSLPAMIAAGAACGASLAGSYDLLFSRASARTWAVYNMTYLGLFMVLAALSLGIYEPVTSTAALMASNEPPRELIEKAFPLSIAFTLGSAGLISGLWGRTLGKAAAALGTTSILMVLFGLNLSVVGLVQMGGEVPYLIGLFFGLVAAILSGNAVVYFALERRRLFAPASPTEAPAVPPPAETTGTPDGITP